MNNSSWKKTNYGGQKMKPSGQRAVFVGRWQPYHMGHIELINQKLEQGVPVLILVRDMEPDDKNPFTTDQSIAMIEAYHKHHNHDVVVMKIPDIESLNFGRGVGYEVNYYEPTQEIASISATKIRDSINQKNDDWKLMVDSSIHSMIINYLSNKE